MRRCILGKNFAETSAELFNAISEGNTTIAGPCWDGKMAILIKLPTPLLNPPRATELNLEKLGHNYVSFDYSDKHDKITP